MPSSPRLRIALPLIASFIGTLCTTALASSWPPHRLPYQTLEQWVSDSSLVVIGRVMEVIAKTNWRLEYRVAVVETIRGSPPATATIIIEQYTEKGWDTAWLHRGNDVIFFLRESEDTLVCSKSMPMDVPSEYGWPTVEFERLKDPKKILARVRRINELLATPTPAMRSSRSLPDPEMFPGVLAYNGNMTVQVPPNQILFEQTLKWADSPNHFLRLSAIDGLDYFVSPQIAPIMLRLLRDPHSELDGQQMWLNTDYQVRRYAGDWLRRHGIAFDPVVISEPNFTPIYWPHFVIGGSVMATMILLCRALARRLRQQQWQVRAPLLAALLLGVALVGGYVASWWQCHEFSLNDGSTRMAVFMRGRMVLVKLDADLNTPGLSYASYRLGGGLEARWKPNDSAKPFSRLTPGVLVDSGNPSPFAYRMIWIPLWPTLLICALVLVSAFHPLLRRQLRIRRGLCLHCGFDLRASAGVCPECGGVGRPAVVAGVS